MTPISRGMKNKIREAGEYVEKLGNKLFGTFPTFIHLFTTYSQGYPEGIRSHSQVIPNFIHSILSS